MTTLPAFKLEIDANPTVTGLFVVNTSTLNGTDVLAEVVRYITVPADDVLSVGIKRGRTRDDQANEVGTATIELDGYSGQYDPDNTGNRYIYNGEPLLRQGMPVRVSVTIAAVDYVLFSGALESSQGGFGREPTMTWTCVDILARLGNSSFRPSTDFERDGDTSVQRVDWLLQYDNAYADRVVTLGGRVLTGTQGGGTVLSNLEDVARSEWGRVYADRDNVLTITDHADEYGKSVTLTISDSAVDFGDDIYADLYIDTYPGLAPLEPTALTVEPGLSTVVNRVILTRPSDDVKFTAEDALSIERFGARTQSANVLLSSDGEVAELAAYLATRAAVPAPRASSVTTSLAGVGSTGRVSAATLDLGDWVQVERTTYDGRQLVWRLTAEGINHDITTTDWTLTLNTAALDLAGLFGSSGWFTLDASTLDGSDVLASY